MRLAIVLGLGLAAAAAALVVGLTPDEPPLVTTGPRLNASLLREWKDGGGPQREAAFSRDGAWLATSNADGNVTVRRMADWRTAGSWTVPGGATSVAFAPGAESLFTGGYDGVVGQWTVADGNERRNFDAAEGTVWSIDVSPDGTELAAAGEGRCRRRLGRQGPSTHTTATSGRSASAPMATAWPAAAST